MKVLDNINQTVGEDLVATIKKGDKLSIAAACFSIFAYQALKRQLDGIDELRFIFTSPTFLKEKTAKASREFYIPQLNRERSLYGTDFEVKLRNELTQKAIARECADWIRKKVRFRSNKTNGVISPFLDVNHIDTGLSYTPLNEFTTAGLGCERGNNIAVSTVVVDHQESRQFLDQFERIWNDNNLLEDVTDIVLHGITAAYKENAPEFIYYVAIYNIFNEFLSDLNADYLPNEATGFKETAIWNKLYQFQKDAALAIINKLEKYNGCILADSVGLGKTFTALAVVKYYELRNKSALVLCPKKLGDNWLTYRENYLNNPIERDHLNYKVLYHTDLSRTSGKSGETDLAKLNWGNYDLVVIDESHNFRNGGEIYKSGEDERENRYLRLMNKVIKNGVKTKVLMLSATPVNNGFSDLRHQLALAYEGDAALINEKLTAEKSVDIIFRQAQTAFNKWSELEPQERTTQELLRSLDFDFFTLLDEVTIARSRKHIQKYYDISEIGSFPKRLEPINISPPLTDLPNAITFSEIFGELMKLNLSVYTPMAFVFESQRGKYINRAENSNNVLWVTGREDGIRRLMAVNLLKRLESSVHSFRLTLERVLNLITESAQTIENHIKGNSDLFDAREMNEGDFDADDTNTDFFHYGKRRPIDLNDVDTVTWLKKLREDADVLRRMAFMIKDITPDHDSKLQELISHIEKKIAEPINPGNKKVLIFSAFSDTADYLYDHLKDKFSENVALITGTTDGKTTAKLPRDIHIDLNTVLTLFSPISKDKRLLMPGVSESIEILVATDCISEGQNLQDCDYCINYDIHWNPVRIIQRFGRIDRIGSVNAQIQLVNFWPDVELDEYINLKGRVETRMKASVMTATGDDNIIDQTEGDLYYRKEQLQRLKSEVVDIEDMQSGVSIMDLGLNEFRLDLLEYANQNKDAHSLEQVPFGLHAVVDGGGEYPAGTIFVLKNRNENINIHDRNRLHPFYLIYVRDANSVYIDHLNPKKLLDTLRQLCKGRTEPDNGLCQAFNTETNDGKDMGYYSDLLYFAVKSIVDIGEESAIDSLFTPGGTSALMNKIDGLDDFELVCFITVK